jgi:hypothetical protein
VADVWALGCTVIEMATGQAPWSGMDGDALAAMHRIGYKDAVPEVPKWLSAEAKGFLAGCFIRRACDRCTAAQLLEHPFLASAVLDTKLEAVAGKWVSPKSTLDAAFWESESDGEEAEDELWHSTADRFKALACPASALPDWDSDEGWIDVLSAAPTEAQDAVAVPVEGSTDLDDAISSEEQTADSGLVDITMDSSDDSVLNVAEGNYGSVGHNKHQSLEIAVCHELLVRCKLFCYRSMNTIDFFFQPKHSASLCSCVALLMFLSFFTIGEFLCSFLIVGETFKPLETSGMNPTRDYGSSRKRHQHRRPNKPRLFARRVALCLVFIMLSCAHFFCR